MNIQHRNVVDRVVDHFEHGHRETDRGNGWERDLHSDYVRMTDTLWFVGTPVQVMRNMGIDTIPERAVEFAQASDDRYEVCYYVANAAQDGNGDEALKWVMSAIAAELNVRKRPFHAITEIISSASLRIFVEYLASKKIDRAFAKPIFADIVAINPKGMIDDQRAAIDEIVSNPKYKAVSADDLEPIIDKIIADNPDQYEKAKANPKLVQWFVGQALKATGGKAVPATVIAIVNRKIAG
jgi:Asp-tRNA(Asn)/Glu-tRNA(Gln) amidotransferase B subunit